MATKTITLTGAEVAVTGLDACWNKWCHVAGNSQILDSSDYINNAPESDHIALWYEVFTGGDINRAFQIAIGCFAWQNNTFIRYQQDGNWSGWKNIADGGNAQTLGTHSVSDFVLKSDYDALAARVSALEGGTT